jgi:ankyrin repeat protein
VPVVFSDLCWLLFLQKLLARDIELSDVDFAGNNALHFASRTGSLSLLQVLLSAGADLMVEVRWRLAVKCRQPCRGAVSFAAIPLC